MIKSDRKKEKENTSSTYPHVLEVLGYDEPMKGLKNCGTNSVSVHLLSRSE